MSTTETQTPSSPATHRLTDFVSTSALQELQDGFTAVTGLQAVIVDSAGVPVTRPSDCERLTEREAALQQTILAGDHTMNQPFPVPIIVEGRRLGAIILTGSMLADICDHFRHESAVLSERFEIAADRREEFAAAIEKLGVNRYAEAVRFVYLLADAIGQVCSQDLTLRQRVEEMTTLYELSALLAGQRDLQQVLDTVARSAAQVLNAKAASIRLLSGEGQELVPKAVYNLSRDYLDKGPILLEKSVIDVQAVQGEVVYVADMATDPRTLYPADAAREGLASIIVAAMIYRGKIIGVMRIYSAEPRIYTDDEKNLLKAIAQLSGAAIENAQLAAEQREAERVRRQVQLAADVQRRMMPRSRILHPPFDIAGIYEPCFELGGDFFDVIPWDRSVGLVVGDVVGKGVAASLLMASVRAGLRAHVEDVYDLDDVMAKVNSALAHDTRDNEFATVFYGTLDADTLRLTYCSAGHDPALLLRGGGFIELDTGGMAMGIDAAQRYDKGLIDLRAGDLLLIRTDGVPDATNFAGEKFGKERIRKALKDMADKDAQTIANHILWEVRRFIGLNNPTDDITLLVVKVDPNHQKKV